jgi:hypothetical protein
MYPDFDHFDPQGGAWTINKALEKKGGGYAGCWIWTSENSNSRQLGE